MTHFLFKERVEDFVVNEVLEKEPAGQGDYHYIFFEKKGLATFDLIRKLQDEFGFNRNMIGIAGLKDKQGVTRQWLSFLKRDVQKYCGGINNLLIFFRKTGKVVTATYDTRMLKLGMNKGNQFEIILRTNSKKANEGTREKVDTILKQMSEFGVPNYFGEQRFGHRGRNWQTGQMLLTGEIRSLKGDNNTMVEKRFKVQAFASYVFNAYIDHRIDKKKLWKIVPGDVVIGKDGKPTFWTGAEIDNKDRLNVTGPVVGDDLTSAKNDALKLEEETYKLCEIGKAEINKFKNFQLFGLRRSLLLYPSDMTRKWSKDNNLMLSFMLTSGAYASVIVDLLEKQLS